MTLRAPSEESHTTGRTRWGVLSLAMMAALCPVPAVADEPGATQEKADPATKVTVFYLLPADFPARDAALITRELNRELRKNRRLAMRDYDKLLAEYAGDIPTAEISAAEELLSEAVKLLTDGSAGEAITKLRETLPKLEQVLAFIKKRRIEQAHMALGVAQAQHGKRAAALRTFTDLLVWRPRAAYNMDLFPAKHLSLFEKARKRVRKIPRGSVELATDPPGAKAYVDGRFAGVTPTATYGLTVGKHYVTFKKSGYIKAGTPVFVSPRRQQSYSLELRRSDKYLLLEQGIEHARQALGQQRASAAMSDLRTLLFIDQAIFAEVARQGKTTTITAYLYDLRSRLRLNQATVSFQPSQISKAGDLARMLYLNVRYDGSVTAPPDPPPPAPEVRKPFYTRWWFWTAVAAGAAAVAVPIVVLSGNGQGCPDGFRCVGIVN